MLLFGGLKELVAASFCLALRTSSTGFCWAQKPNTKPMVLVFRDQQKPVPVRTMWIRFLLNLGNF